ncbi:MAG: bacillithiol biosynthesis BshC [Thermoanaerobaculia bacterium]
MTSTETPADCRSFALGEYPGISRFALDLVRRAPAATRFVTPPDGALSPADVVRDSALVAALNEQNRGWGNDVGGSLDRWAEGRSVALIAGQQTGFAGGPLYTLAKIASLLHAKDELAAKGVESTIFFWLATEDHDYDEVATITIDSQDGAVTLRAAERPLTRRMVGEIALPESLRRAFIERSGIDGEFLRPGISFRDSFARLIASVVPGEVVLVDALLPELRRAGAPLFEKIVREWDAVQEGLRERRAAIESAGYPPQIVADEDGTYTLLYLTREGVRLPIAKKGQVWTLAGRKSSAEELLAIIHDAPESVSTSALTRPALQDLVLHPQLFVGGPAEVSYYAQSSVIHEICEIPRPAVALRGHVLLASSKILRKIDRWGLGMSEVFDPVDSILARREEPARRELEVSIERARRAFLAELEPLADAVRRSDGSLDRPVTRSLRKIRYQLQRLGERGERALGRRDVERLRAIQKITGALNPLGQPQDRVAAWITWWDRFGSELVRRMRAVAAADSDRVTVIGL